MHRHPSMLDMEEERRSFGSGLEILEPRPLVYWGGLEERMGSLWSLILGRFGLNCLKWGYFGIRSNKHMSVIGVLSSCWRWSLTAKCGSIDVNGSPRIWLSRLGNK
jgi:hypothetical protein